MSNRFSILFLLTIFFCQSVKSVTPDQVREAIKEQIDESFFDTTLDRNLFWFDLDNVSPDLLSKMINFAKPIHELFSTPLYLQLPKNPHTGATQLNYIVDHLPLINRTFVKCLLEDCSLEESKFYGFNTCQILKGFVEKLLSDQSYFTMTNVGRGDVFKIENANEFLRESFAQCLDEFFLRVPNIEKLTQLLAIIRNECGIFSRYLERSYGLDGYIKFPEPRRADYEISGSARFRGWLLFRTQDAINRIQSLKKAAPLCANESTGASNGLCCWNDYAPLT